MRERIAELWKAVDREAWVRFLVGIFGLAFAFAAAMLSTAARESGNALASAVLASSALILAGVVAIATVPYLARRAALERVRDVFNYDVTREGAVYLLLTLVIAIAALNTGNNLLFIVVSAMIAAVLVSGVASATVLLGVEVDLELPGHLFARETYVGAVALRNRRRFLPAFSISVVPPIRKAATPSWKWQRSMFVFPKEVNGRKAWVRFPDVSLIRVEREMPIDIFTDRVFFPYIPARQTQRAEVTFRFEQRGRYRQDGVAVSSRFPFSFLAKTRTVALTREVVVYPSVEATDEFFEVLPMVTGEFESYMRGRGSDLYRIRDYQPEDSARHVDWKSTAKSGALKVREFTREDERKLRIVFDNPAPGEVLPQNYEQGIQLAASLAWHFGGENTVLSFAAPYYSGSSDVYEFLDYLASVQPKVNPSVLEELKVTDDYNIVITAQKRGTIASDLWQSSYFIFLNE